MPGDESVYSWERYTGFRRLLHGFLNEAVRRLILGFGEEASWEDHVEVLEEYAAFCYDKRASTAATRANSAYVDFRAKYMGS